MERPPAIIIVSGGQTGVDRAALDTAIELSIPYTGWCPKGGWAEDMEVPPGLRGKYERLRETPSADPAQRTEWNVRDSDGTLFIVPRRGLDVSPGSVMAARFCDRYNKPLLEVKPMEAGAVVLAATWLTSQLNGNAVNIAGPRESEAPGIYAESKAFLHQLLATVCLRCTDLG